MVDCQCFCSNRCRVSFLFSHWCFVISSSHNCGGHTSLGIDHSISRKRRLSTSTNSLYNFRPSSLYSLRQLRRDVNYRYLCSIRRRCYPHSDGLILSAHAFLRWCFGWLAFVWAWSGVFTRSMKKKINHQLHRTSFFYQWRWTPGVLLGYRTGKISLNLFWF